MRGGGVGTWGRGPNGSLYVGVVRHHVILEVEFLTTPAYDESGTIIDSSYKKGRPGQESTDSSQVRGCGVHQRVLGQSACRHQQPMGLAGSMLQYTSDLLGVPLAATTRPTPAGV